MKISIIPNIKSARVYNISHKAFRALLKLNIEKMRVSLISMIDVNGVQKVDYVKTITIIDRGVHEGIQQIYIKDHETKEMLWSTYNIALDMYKNSKSDPTVQLVVEIPIDIYKQKRSLIPITEYVNDNIIDSCVYIDLYKDGETIELRFKDNRDSTSNVVYYFENDTVLAFTEKGPELITDNAQISGFIDIAG